MAHPLPQPLPLAEPVNCLRRHHGKCLDGRFGGRPSPGVCKLGCAHRQPRDGSTPTPPVPMGVIVGPPIAASPRGEWPLWASLIAERAAPGDRGVGDTVERELGAAGEKFKAWWKATLEKHLRLGCGCDGRRDRWNARYPYGPSST